VPAKNHRDNNQVKLSVGLRERKGAFIKGFLKQLNSFNARYFKVLGT
jgi:hypothetical protein